MYTVNFTSLSKSPIIVNDNATVGTIGPTSLTLDPLATTASLPILLYGKGVLDWGERIQENLVQVLENFDGNTAPVYPTNGQLWHKNAGANDHRLQVYHNSAWKNVLVLTDSNTPPSNPFRAQLWYDSTNGYMYWDGSSWSPLYDGAVPLTGGTMTGFLTLFADPTAAMEAATKQYVDNQIATQAVTINGGVTVTNNFSLSATPSAPNHVVNKLYVDTEISSVTSSLSGYVAKAGDTMTGYLTLNADPVNALHAASKQYVDAAVSGGGLGYTPVNKAGDTMLGVLILSADPITAAKQAATKEYVDNAPFFNPTVGGTISAGTIFSVAPESVAPTLGAHLTTKTYTDGTFLKLVGGSVTGNISSSATPSASAHLITRAYADTRYLQLSGGTLVGSLTVDPTFEIFVSTAPSTNDSLTNKSYVDGVAANYVLKGGDTMTGFLTLNGAPTSSLHAATKQYVDDTFTSVGSSFVAIGGDTMTGDLIVPDILVSSVPSNLSQVVNYNYIEGNYLRLNGGTIATKITYDDPDVAGFPTVAGDLVPKKYVDDIIDTEVVLIDGLAPMTGPLTLSGDPTINLHAATKQYVDNNVAAAKIQSIVIPCSDENTALTAGTAKVTFRMPYAFTLTDVRASLTTAQTSGSVFTVDINESGVSILSTNITIDNTEKTSTTAATPAVISDTTLADDAEITIDIDQIGDGTATGLKIYLIGVRT